MYFFALVFYMVLQTGRAIHFSDDIMIATFRDVARRITTLTTIEEIRSILIRYEMLLKYC